MIADSWYGPQLEGYYAPGSYGPQLADSAIYAPTRTTTRNRYTDAENALRQLVPGTWADDFAVGNFRIATGRVGVDGNPTWDQAWTATDKTFGGFLPGGVAPDPLSLIPDQLEDFVKKLLFGAVVVGAVVLASR